MTSNQQLRSSLIQSSNSFLHYDEYAFSYTQDAGVFVFDYYLYDIASDSAHIIRSNTFEHIYCERGCAYSAKGTSVQQFWFQQNTYTYMVASGGGAVFDSSYLLLSASNKFRDVWL